MVVASIPEETIRHTREESDNMNASQVPGDIVESMLLAIITDPAVHQVVMRFRLQEHEFGLRADGVDHMQVNEFLQQNIVDEVRLFGRDSDLSVVRDLLATLLFDCERADEVIEPGLISKLESAAQAIIEGQKVFFELVPVYGASILLLASSIEWLDSGAADVQAGA